MLGIEDPWVIAPYILCILSALLCVAWGIVKWNKDGLSPKPDEKTKHWIEEESRVTKEL